VKKFHTDILALVCVFGGGAVAGAATLALMRGDSGPRPACAVESVLATPRVVVSSTGDAGAFIVRPDVRVHMDHDCVVEVQEDVRVHVEEVRREMERARAQVEEARRHTERVRVRVQREHLKEAQAQAEAQFQFQFQHLDPLKLEIDGLVLALESELEPEVEARIQAKLQDLQERLERDLKEKLEKGRGGTTR
jgi:hypothetical protein